MSETELKKEDTTIKNNRVVKLKELNTADKQTYNEYRPITYDAKNQGKTPAKTVIKLPKINVKDKNQIATKEKVIHLPKIKKVGDNKKTTNYNTIALPSILKNIDLNIKKKQKKTKSFDGTQLTIKMCKEQINYQMQKLEQQKASITNESEFYNDLKDMQIESLRFLKKRIYGMNKKSISEEELAKKLKAGWEKYIDQKLKQVSDDKRSSVEQVINQIQMIMAFKKAKSIKDWAESYTLASKMYENLKKNENKAYKQEQRISFLENYYQQNKTAQDQLKLRIQQLESVNQSVQNDLSIKTRLSEQLQQRIDGQTVELNALNNSKKQVETMYSGLFIYISSIDIKDNTIEELRSLLERKVSSDTTSSLSSETKREIIETVLQQVTSLKTKDEQSSTELQSEYVKVTSENTKLKNALVKIEKELSDHKLKVQSLESNSIELSTKIRKHKKHATKMQSEFSEILKNAEAKYKSDITIMDQQFTAKIASIKDAYATEMKQVQDVHIKNINFKDLLIKIQEQKAEELQQTLSELRTQQAQKDNTYKQSIDALEQKLKIKVEDMKVLQSGIYETLEKQRQEVQQKDNQIKELTQRYNTLSDEQNRKHAENMKNLGQELENERANVFELIANLKDLQLQQVLQLAQQEKAHQENEQLRKQLESAESELKSTKNKETDLTNELDQKNKKLLALKKSRERDLSKLREESDTMLSQHQYEMRQLQEKHKKDIDLLRSTFNTESINLKDLLERSIAENARLSVSIETTNESNKLVLQLNQQKLEQTVSELEALQAKSVDMQEQIKQQLQQLNQKDATILDINQKIDDMDMDLTKVKKDLETAQNKYSTDIETLRESLADTEKLMKQIEGELNHKGNALLDVQNKLRTASDTITTLQNQLIDQEPIIERIKELEGHRADVNELRSELRNAANEANMLKTKEKDIQVFFKGLETYIKSSADISNASELERIKHELTASSTSTKEFADIFFESFSVYTNKTKRELAAKESEILSLTKLKENLESELATLHIKETDTSITISDLSENLLESDKRIQDLEKSLKQQRQQHETAIGNINKEKEELAQRNIDIQEIHSTHTVKMSNHEIQLQNQILELSAQNSKKDQEIRDLQDRYESESIKHKEEMEELKHVAIPTVDRFIYIHTDDKSKAVDILKLAEQKAALLKKLRALENIHNELKIQYGFSTDVNSRYEKYTGINLVNPIIIGN